SRGLIFDSAVLPSDLGNGFAIVSLSLSGGNATVNAHTIGINSISGLSLMQGNTIVATFTDQNNGFSHGSFTRTIAIDPALASQIAASPSSFFFGVDTGRGTVTGPLMAPTNPVLSGVLSGPSGGTGTFLFTFGQPVNEFGDVPITFDAVSRGVGND